MGSSWQHGGPIDLSDLPSNSSPSESPNFDKIGGIKLKTRFSTCTGAKLSPLVSSAKQGATSSCKASSDISSVDGTRIIGSPSGMSTVGLELMNYINPDLTWKTVAKGYRSSSRRSRKHFLRNFAVGEELLHQVSRKVDEGTASDTEKHGVAILGRRFSDKIENIPLKKRRLMLRSNSPPHRPLFEAPANGKRRVRASCDGARDCLENKSTKVNETTFDSSEDFSGMEILAAVACSNSMIGDVDLDIDRSLLDKSTRDGIGSCTSEAPVVKNGSSSNGTACEEADKESSLLGKSEGPLQIPLVTKENEDVEGSGSAHDDRLHWDLNVPVDAWEKPRDASTIESQANASVYLSTGIARTIEVAKISEATVELKDIPDSFAKPVSQDSKVELPLGRHEASSGHNEFETSVELDADSKGRIPISVGNEHLVCEVPDVKGSSKVTGAISSLGHLETPRNSRKDGDASTSPVSLDLEKATHETDACFIEDGQDTGTGISVSNVKPVQFVPNSKSSEDAELLSCAVNLEASFSESSGDLFASGVPAEVDSPSHVPAEVDSPHERSEDMMQKSSGDSTSTPKEVSGIQDNGPTSSLANMTTGDPSDDSYGSDVYQTDKVGMVGDGSNNELQAGYDSQFEDGELRESDPHYYWDENEGEDGEVEHVDYGSEYGDEERPGSMNEKEVDFEGGSTPGSHDRKVNCIGKADITHDDSASPKSRVLDVPLEKGLASGPTGTRALQGEFATCAEGPDARKNPYSRSRSENCRNGFPRDERDTGGPRRYMGRERIGIHMRGRSPGRYSGNPSTSYWNFERRCSPTRPSYLPCRPRPKNNVEDRRYMMSSDRNMDSDAGGGYFQNRLNRQFVNSPPNGVYERIMRRRSPPSNRDDSYMNTRMLPMREMTPPRGRFRRFPPGGIRDEFRTPLLEDSAEYPNRMGHRVLKRDRSISPLPRPLPRRPHIAMPYRRSRSRSPPIYLQRREQQRNDGGGGVGSVLRCRSPDGMRARQPFQKRFAAKYDDRFTSPTRHQFSNRMRSFDDRVVDGFRGGGGRKSPPARLYRQQQQQGNNRFDSQRSFRVHDEFRPAGKFRDGVNANRGNSGREFEGSDDDRSKRNHRFEMPRPRRYDTEEGSRPVRPFRWNADDSADATNDSSNFDNAGCNNSSSGNNDRGGGPPKDVIRRAAVEVEE